MSQISYFRDALFQWDFDKKKKINRIFRYLWLTWDSFENLSQHAFIISLGFHHHHHHPHSGTEAKNNMDVSVHMKSNCWVYPYNIHGDWRIFILLGAILLISEISVRYYSPRIQIQPPCGRKMRLRMSCILLAPVFQQSVTLPLWQNWSVTKL